MAEGLAKKILGDGFWIESAGSAPKTVNPLAIKAMEEVQINIISNYSKSIGQLPVEFSKSIDFVITLCAEEVCPVVNFPTAKKIRWLFADPASAEGTDLIRLAAFRNIRHQITEELKKFKVVMEKP